jgi:hypothetical protein
VSNEHPQVTTIRKYLACMDAGDVTAAAALFADCALYVRPPVLAPDGTTGEAIRLVGREAIAAQWATRIGRTTHHVITHAATTGAEAFVEGTAVVNDRAPVLFASHATFDEDGRFARFVAFR